MANELVVYVSPSDVAQEMVSNPSFAYDVFKEVAWYAYEGKDESRFMNRLFAQIFENEDSDILYLFEDIVKQFEHLKEKD